MAVGDSGNDVEMLRYAGRSVAMENGTPEAKAAAKYRTASNEQDGCGTRNSNSLFYKALYLYEKTRPSSSK